MQTLAHPREIWGTLETSQPFAVLQHNAISLSPFCHLIQGKHSPLSGLHTRISTCVAGQCLPAGL